MGLSRTNSSHHCININNSIKHPGLITTPLTLIIWYGSLPYKRLKVGLGVDFREYAALVDFGLLVLVAVGSGDYLFNQPSCLTITVETKGVFFTVQSTTPQNLKGWY